MNKVKNEGFSGIEKLQIFYFSGTGNASSAAFQIADYATGMGCKAAVSNIADNPDLSFRVSGSQLIGFCYPTHGFNAPPNVLKFLLKFPEGKAKVFLLNTRAGMKLYKLHTPGLGGVALWLPAIILKLKGYRIVGYRPLDLPSNWISIHPGVRKKVVESLVARCKKTVENFTQKIFSGKKVWNGFLWLPLDIAVLPLTVGYYFYGRFVLAKTFFASHECTNCGICIKGCPVNAIKYVNKRPYWTFNCESCMKCMNHCPERAIETAHGFTALLWWLVFSWVPVSLVKLMHSRGIISESFYQQNYQLIVDGTIAVTGLIVIFFGYHLLHQLLRVKIINKLITWTSLTRFRFWRRYKNPYPGNTTRHSTR